MEEEKNIIELELYFVRHGNSRTNAGLPAETPEEKHDPELTERGALQAELVGRRFAPLALDCVITSGLRRAQATAQAILDHQPENGAHTMEILPILTEWGIPEEYPGKTMEEIRERFPAAVRAPGTEEYSRMINHTHPGDEVLSRGKQAVDYLRARFRHGEKVLVAGHGCQGGYMLYAALGLNLDEEFTFSIYNTGVTKIVFYKKGSGAVKDTGLVYFNDHSHLFADFPTHSFDEMWN